MAHRLSSWQAAMLCLLFLAFPANALSALKELKQRPLAPDFTLPDLNGEAHRLYNLRGKVVLINFWATWCPPCRAEMPALQRTWERLKGKDFAMLAVAINESEGAIARFFLSLSPSPTFTVLLDQHMDMASLWPLKGLPATFVLDKRGRVVYVMHGALDWDTPNVIKRINRLIEERGPKFNVQEPGKG